VLSIISYQLTITMAMITHEQSTIWARLNVFDLGKVRELYELRKPATDSIVVSMLSDVFSRHGGQILIGLTDPAANTDEGLTHICASGLTAREVMNRIGMIPQCDLRNKLAETILPYISSPPSKEFAQKFSVAFNLDDLEDEKGDITVEDHSSDRASSSRVIKVYYAKCLLRRENNKYHINLAYYHFDSSIPLYHLIAFFRSKQTVKEELALASAVAYNRLHRHMKSSWPDRIELVEVTNPSDIEQA
jgi:hypothetical protein